MILCYPVYWKEILFGVCIIVSLKKIEGARFVRTIANSLRDILFVFSLFKPIHFLLARSCAAKADNICALQGRPWPEHYCCALLFGMFTFFFIWSFMFHVSEDLNCFLAFA